MKAKVQLLKMVQKLLVNYREDLPNGVGTGFTLDIDEIVSFIRRNIN